MKDFQCFLLIEQFTSILHLKDLGTLFIQNDFIELKQKNPSLEKNITCFIKKQSIEINEKITNQYMLLFTVFTENRIFIITDSPYSEFIEKEFIQWDFSLRIGINASFIKQMENKIRLPFHKDYILSLDENLNGESLQTIFKEQNYLILKGNIDYNEIADYCSILYSVYASDISNNHFSFYKKIDYMDNLQICSQFIKILQKNLLNKNRNNILISYPSPDIFDVDGFFFINGKIEKKYSDVGISELCDFLGHIYKNESEWDLHKIEIRPIKGKQKVVNHSLLDLIIFEFDYKTEKYVYNNNSIYMIS